MPGAATSGLRRIGTPAAGAPRARGAQRVPGREEGDVDRLRGEGRLDRVRGGQGDADRGDRDGGHDRRVVAEQGRAAGRGPDRDRGDGARVLGVERLGLEGAGAAVDERDRSRREADEGLAPVGLRARPVARQDDGAGHGAVGEVRAVRRRPRREVPGERRRRIHVEERSLPVVEGVGHRDRAAGHPRAARRRSTCRPSCRPRPPRSTPARAALSEASAVTSFGWP